WSSDVCSTDLSTSTVEDHAHTVSPSLAGLGSCAQAFRGPNSILRGTQTHTKWATTGRPASQVLRSPPLLSTGEDRSRATSGPRLDHPPSHSEARAGPPATRPSPPLPSNAANWQRAGHIGIAPPGTYPGTSKAAAPTTPPPSYPGPRSPGHGPRDIAADRLPPRPSVSPSAAKAHARSIQSTGEGSWTSRAGPRAPEMPVAAP